MKKDTELQLYQVVLSRSDPLGPKAEVKRGVYVVATSEENALYQLSELVGHKISTTADGSTLVSFGPVDISKLLH